MSGDAMPETVRKLRTWFETRREAPMAQRAPYIMGYTGSRPDKALTVATHWLPGLYESPDGLLFLAGVVDDPCDFDLRRGPNR